ncbi:MAG: hypothetical protein NC930_01100, partial [Candidatus Omnitrophica bacterium]|nr:hypothetical protein [Candidatus Omnitrophota bacterium]
EIGHLFTPFYSTKPLSEGNGLGLCLTQKLVGKNQGRMVVSSFPKQGTSCQIEFRVGRGTEERRMGKRVKG